MPVAVCEIRNGVVVREQRTVSLDEVEEMGHLLEVGRHARVVTPEMGIVELNIDHVLDAPAREFSWQVLCAEAGTLAAINIAARMVERQQADWSGWESFIEPPRAN